MTEQEVRELVRTAIARRRAPEAAMSAVAAPEAAGRHTALLHPSHHRFLLPAGDGPCLIEPAVQCNHCGFCQSYGH